MAAFGREVEPHESAGAHWDAEILDIKLPSIRGVPELGSEARFDRGLWPVCPQGTIDDRDLCPEPEVPAKTAVAALRREYWLSDREASIAAHERCDGLEDNLSDHQWYKSPHYEGESDAEIERRRRSLGLSTTREKQPQPSDIC
jgi:hypothetical protein